MKSSLLELQKAVYARLHTKISCPIYDEVPRESPFPYVTIGEDTAVGAGSKLDSGEEVTIYIHVWSQQPGATEVKTIIGECLEQLTENMDSMNFVFVGIREEFTQILREADGKTRHGVIRIRCYANQIY